MSEKNGKLLITDLDYQDIADDYSLDNDNDNDNEDSYFEDAKKDRQFYEKTQTESNSEGDRDFTSDYEFAEQEPENYYETYTDSDEQNFVFMWKFMDETRAAMLSAAYDRKKEDLLFYPDIHKAGHNSYLKRAGGAVVKKYSDLILYANKPEIIIALAFAFSTFWMWRVAKKVEKGYTAEERSRDRARAAAASQSQSSQHQQKREDKTEAFRPIQTS